MAKQRTRQHVIGDIASGQAQLVFLKADWVVNTISSDYGEDLLVAPTLDENVDTFHLLVQVKGIDSAPEDGTWSRSFYAEDVERWLRMRVPVMVVLWSLEQNCGRFCMPRRQHSLSKLLKTVRERKEKERSTPPTVTLYFKETDIFESNELRRLAWSFRLDDTEEIIELYRDAYLEAANALHEEESVRKMTAHWGRQNRNDNNDIEGLKQAVKIAQDAWDERLDELLQLLGVLDAEEKIDEQLVNTWNKDVEQLIESNPSMNDDEVFEIFFGLWLHEKTNEKHGVSVHSTLSDSLARRIWNSWPSNEKDDHPVDTE